MKQFGKMSAIFIEPQAPVSTNMRRPWVLGKNYLRFIILMHSVQIYSKLDYLQSFVHAPNNPFGQHLSWGTIHTPTDGRKSEHFKSKIWSCPTWPLMPLGIHI